MSRKTVIAILFSLAAACGLWFLWLTIHIGHAVAYGATPSSDGIASIVVSALSASGFTVAGIVTWFIHWMWPGAKPADDDSQPDHGKPDARVVEVVAAFGALMKDRESKPAQRRFIFALVDAGSLFNGVKTSHENGVVHIDYSGYADPSPAPVAGGKP